MATLWERARGRQAAARKWRYALCVLVGCDDSQPIADLMLFQELLCQVLQIPAGVPQESITAPATAAY